jgi:hypothetical protein
MPFIDRTAATVWPKQPFLDWVKSLPGADLTLTLEQARTQPTVFLLPPADDAAEVKQWFTTGSDLLFIHMLASVTQDETRIPQARDHAMFLKWFDCEITPLVNDLMPFFEQPGAEGQGHDHGGQPPAGKSGIEIVSR